MDQIKNVIILGTAGNAVDILDAINEINVTVSKPLYKCIGFLDDNITLFGRDHFGVKVLGPLEKAQEFTDAYVINGIGNDQNFLDKETIIGRTKVPLERFITLKHPTASVSKTAHIGFGTMIFQNVTITSNARIGNHVMIMPNSVISHDVIIGDYSIITGGVCISGRVHIGKSSYIGTNASIIGDAVIGEYSLIGMGAVVVDNIPPHSVFVGNPAKLLRKI